MIKSFRHKGLEKFFCRGSKAGIQADHAKKLTRQLTTLNSATSVEDMRVASWNLHSLHGTLDGHWSIGVSGIWRLTFKFENDDAILVDYQDYH
jgi:proteic killer suppression protein